MIRVPDASPLEETGATITARALGKDSRCSFNSIRRIAMKHFHLLSLASVVALTVAPVIAQGQAAPAPTSPAAAAQPVDCGKPTMKRHDHTAGKGGSSDAGSMQMNKPCPPEAAASASKSTARKGKRHDHGATKNN